MFYVGFGIDKDRLVILARPPEIKLILLKVISPLPPVSEISPIPKITGEACPSTQENQPAVPVLTHKDCKGSPLAVATPLEAVCHAVFAKGIFTNKTLPPGTPLSGAAGTVVLSLYIFIEEAEGFAPLLKKEQRPEPVNPPLRTRVESLNATNTPENQKISYLFFFSEA